MQTRAQRYLRCPKCGSHRNAPLQEYLVRPGGGQRVERRTGTFTPKYAYLGIVPTGRDNGRRKMAGRGPRARVEVRHEYCGYTWWTTDRRMIERVRRDAEL